MGRKLDTKMTMMVTLFVLLDTKEPDIEDEVDKNKEKNIF
jgi:hypothetical protein